MSPEPRDVRLKRMKMRAMRRGIKEMDLILSAYADQRMEGMSASELDLFDALLDEYDPDLYAWITGQVAAPEQFQVLIKDVAQTLQR